MGVSRNRALQNLMTGLIYPAVLGTIIFSGLQVAESNLRILLEGKSYVFSSVVFLKCLLFLITLIFYGCDYLYATYTKDYRRRFFLCDLVFVISLYATVQMIGIEDGVKDADSLPRGWAIGLFYLIFMFLYWLWDKYERGRCAAVPGLCELGELEFYDEVVSWEKWAIILLIPTVISLFCWPESMKPLVVLTLLLGGITGFFLKHAWKKKSYYVEPGDEPVASRAPIQQVPTNEAPNSQKKVPCDSVKTE